MADKDNNDGKALFFVRSFEISEPIKDKDTNQWKSSVVAKILYKKKFAPDPPLDAIISVVGGESHCLMTDSETGEVKLEELVFAKAATYTIQVALVDHPGVMMTRRVTVKSEEKKAKVPKSVDVHVTGPRGRQKLFISVSAEDNTLIPNFKGPIIDGTDRNEFITGPDGIGVYEMHFDEPGRVVDITLGSEPSAIWKTVIPGPKTPQTSINPLVRDLERRIVS